MSILTGLRKCPCHPKVDLERKTYDVPYKCGGCKMDGTEIGHKCPKCKYVLHSQCLNPRQLIRPSFLPNHTFVFMTSPITKKPQRFCDACGMKTEGFVYHCSSSNYDLHPCCASLQKTIDLDGFKLTFETETTLRTCYGCNSHSVKGTDKAIPGWCYLLKDDSRNGYHVYCVVNRVVEELKSQTLSKRGFSSSSGTDIYFTIFTALVNYVIAILSHDPVAITKLVVCDVIQIAQFLSHKK